nr:maltase-glucoamylase, intestinal-like [Onthophagus taurus]
MLHGLLAYPLISIPICGSTKHFDLDSQIELCTRWYMMGAFMPILKINSEAPYRDPTSFDTDHHRNLVLNAFKFREKFFLYLYTILIKEEPIIRPMFYEFYSDLSTFHLDEQYMVGENLLLAQPFSPESSLMRVYLPQNETFYEYFGGMEYSGDRLGWVNLTYRPTDWFVFVRGGSILILLDEKVENEVKVEYFQVVVALKTGEGDESKKEAFGSVILDGIELSVKSTESEVTISKDGSQDCCINGLDYPKIIDSFIFYGLNESKVEFNSVNFDFCGDNCVYTLT